MQLFIELAYFASTAVGIIATIPQIRQLIILKRSDELSVSTWITWVVCQFVSLIYAISIAAVAYIIVCLAWISLYLLMVGLIIRYRPKQPAETPLSTRILPSKPATGFVK